MYLSPPVSVCIMSMFSLLNRPDEIQQQARIEKLINLFWLSFVRPQTTAHCASVCLPQSDFDK